MNLASFSLVFAGLLSLTLGAAEIRQWVDQDGQIHFGDIAPVGVAAETKSLDETPQIGSQEEWQPRPGEREMLRQHEDRGRDLKASKAVGTRSS